MKTLKPYQRKYVDKIINRSTIFLDEDDNETIVFQSPTGSGKTFMMTKALSELSEKITDKDICFFWISIGKGNIHEQSYKSFKNEMHGNLTCFLLEDNYFKTHTSIRNNEVVFVNWEKLNHKDKNTGNWISAYMQNGDDINIIELLKNTREQGRKIILIIDESHYASDSDRAIEIRDEIIKPKLTIEMSATPTIEGAAKIQVDPNEVVEDGMIKKEIIVNNNGTTQEDELTSQEIVMQRAYDKRIELKKLYEQEGSSVNPLVIIQLPNSDAGADKRLFVENYLLSKGVTSDKIAIWLNDEKINKEHEKLIPIDSKVEFLIFKQAVDTGWDCPRAHILVKFRETASVIFEIQTVGRILRMPEAKHYSNEKLNIGYVYTNIKSIEVKKDMYNLDIIKSLKSECKENVEIPEMRTYYRSRIKQGVLTSDVFEDLEKSFCQYFNIKKETKKFEKNVEKLKNKGIEINDFSDMDTILNNVTVDSKNIDSLVLEKIEGDTISSNYSTNDLQNVFEYMIKSNLNGFAPVKSIAIMKEAIYKVFNKYCDFKKNSNGFIYIQNIVVKNYKDFSIVFDQATKSYLDRYDELINSKVEKIFDEHWKIPQTKNYNPATTIKYHSKLSLYQPLYIQKTSNNIGNTLEEKFIDFLDENEEEIEWFWQNGQENIKTNFGIEKIDSTVFRPDFIVKFKDGKIGIYDTKGGQYPEDDKIKSNALQKYISEENSKGKNVTGGLIIKNGEHFMIFNKKEFKTYQEAPKEWEYFDKL